jgi:hypothetical protein
MFNLLKINEMEKPKLTDVELKYRLIEIFENGITIYTECLESLRTKFTISNERFAEFYHITIKDWSETKLSAQMEMISHNTKESIKIGLKTKQERLLSLQYQINDIEIKLSHGKALQNTFQDGELILSERFLTPKEIIDYKRLLKDFHSELSKMDGSYAPIKAESNLTDTDIHIVRHPAHDRIKKRPTPED